MLRRVWYYLRDLVWTAVLSAVLIIAAVLVATVFGAVPLGGVLALCAVALAVLSTRS